MNVSEAIYQRRSIRRFTSSLIEPEKIEILLKSAMQAPSAGNQQPWEFLVITSKKTLFHLSKTHPYATPLENATLGIVMLSNQKSLKYSEYWQQDLAAATQTLLLQAVELGLGAVWTGIAPDEGRMNYIEKLFNLPSHIIPFALLALGYPAYPSITENRFNAKKIHYETYCEERE